MGEGDQVRGDQCRVIRATPEIFRNARMANPASHVAFGSMLSKKSFWVIALDCTGVEVRQPVLSVPVA